MGTQRRSSDTRRAMRLGLLVEDRPTLVTCPACEGSGSLNSEFGHGRYRARKCGWCGGHGCVDAIVMGLHLRWLRMLQASRLSGRCQRGVTGASGAR